MDSQKKEVGSISVKPNGIGWKTAHDTQWFELTLKDFRNLVTEHGTKGEPP